MGSLRLSIRVFFEQLPRAGGHSVLTAHIGEYCRYKNLQTFIYDTIINNTDSIINKKDVIITKKYLLIISVNSLKNGGFLKNFYFTFFLLDF